MISRNITRSVLAALTDTPIVFLAGARQTGKSTLVRQIASEFHPAAYLSFDDQSVFIEASRDPTGFLAGLKKPVVLDEVQRVPALFPAMRAYVDRDRRPGQFLLTGSANVLLIPQVAGFLVGRMEVLVLWPFTQGEMIGVRDGFIDAAFSDGIPDLSPPFQNRDELVQRILLGGFPEVQSRPDADRRRAWFQAYLMNMLTREVLDYMQIEDKTRLPRLMYLLAARSGGVTNLADLSREVSVPHTTLRRDLVLLESLYLTQTIPSWTTNRINRVSKAPKLFLTDTGILADLMDASPERCISEGRLIGSLMETFVLDELLRQNTWSKLKPSIFHFRTQSGPEVDILLEDRRGRLVAIEVKSGSSVGPGDNSGISVLAKAFGERFHRGIILYNGQNIIPLGRNIHAVPIDALWRWGCGA